jgi:hypothetical protein
MSSDNGNTWSVRNSGLMDLNITSLCVKDSNLIIARDAGSTATLTITSSTPWVVNGSLTDWLSASSFSGQGTGQILFTATKANPYDPPRFFPLDISSCGITRHLTIEQGGKLTGMTELSKSGLWIYPNPTSGKIIIQSPLSADNLTVFRSQGEIVLEQSLVDSKSILDLSSFGKGIYYIRVSGKNGTSVKEVVVL